MECVDDEKVKERERERELYILLYSKMTNIKFSSTETKQYSDASLYMFMMIKKINNMHYLIHNLTNINR